MSEDQNAGYQVQGARPRRTVRQPTYLQDFELQYAGLPRANVLLPQSTPQPHGSDDVQQYDYDRDLPMAHPHASSIYHDQREEAVGSPDSLESPRSALEPWTLPQIIGVRERNTAFAGMHVLHLLMSKVQCMIWNKRINASVLLSYP